MVLERREVDLATFYTKSFIGRRTEEHQQSPMEKNLANPSVKETQVLTSKYVHTFVKTLGRGCEDLTGFGNFTTQQIAWLKRRFGKLAF